MRQCLSGAYRFLMWNCLTIFAALFLIGGMARGADLAALVNPFVGTAAGGNIVPGAIAPFGMVELSPDMPNGFYVYVSSNRWAGKMQGGFGFHILSSP